MEGERGEEPKWKRMVFSLFVVPQLNSGLVWIDSEAEYSCKDADQ
jgi:hypothetical protein